MFDLLGVDMPPFVKFFIAFATVLILIGLTAWLVRRFGANRLGGANARGRQPRLAVIDAATVDGRRRLVLIRRDNVEHLLMIGGPTDLVVEPNILRAGQRDSVREPVRPEPALRSQSADNAFPLQPVNEPAAACCAGLCAAANSARDRGAPLSRQRHRGTVACAGARRASASGRQPHWSCRRIIDSPASAGHAGSAQRAATRTPSGNP